MISLLKTVEEFSIFSVIFFPDVLFLISSLIVILRKHILYAFIFFNLLRLVADSGVWSIAVNISRALEKNVYSVVVENNVLKISFMSRWW